jgi:hypothetical protein
MKQRKKHQVDSKKLNKLDPRAKGSKEGYTNENTF